MPLLMAGAVLVCVSVYLLEPLLLLLLLLLLLFLSFLFFFGGCWEGGGDLIISFLHQTKWGFPELLSILIPRPWSQ